MPNSRESPISIERFPKIEPRQLIRFARTNGINMDEDRFYSTALTDRLYMPPFPQRLARYYGGVRLKGGLMCLRQQLHIPLSQQYPTDLIQDFVTYPTADIAIAGSVLLDKMPDHTIQDVQLTRIQGADESVRTRFLVNLKKNTRGFSALSRVFTGCTGSIVYAPEGVLVRIQNGDATPIDPDDALRFSGLSHVYFFDNPSIFSSRVRFGIMQRSANMNEFPTQKEYEALVSFPQVGLSAESLMQKLLVDARMIASSYIHPITTDNLPNLLYVYDLEIEFN